VNAAAKRKGAPAPKQQQLALTYSVGDWVWAKSGWTPRQKLPARIESAQSIRTELGEVWLVRCYYSPKKRIAKHGWSKTSEHRRVECALNQAEIVHLRQVGIIPPAGSDLP
jgi:hypothetical protein